MKRGYGILIAVLLFLIIFISGCSTKTDTPVTEKPVTPGLHKTVMVFIDEDPKDPNNLKEINIANITIAQGGKLELTVIKDVPQIERLKSAIKEIEAKEGLLLQYDDKVGDTYYLKSELVGPTDPRYGYALEGELMIHYGFKAEMR